MALKKKKPARKAAPSKASLAAKKGWATRRAEHAKRVRAAKKGWATRRKVVRPKPKSKVPQHAKKLATSRKLHVKTKASRKPHVKSKVQPKRRPAAVTRVPAKKVTKVPAKKVTKVTSRPKPKPKPKPKRKSGREPAVPRGLAGFPIAPEREAPPAAPEAPKPTNPFDELSEREQHILATWEGLTTAAKEQWFKFLSPKGKEMARDLERRTRPIAGPTKPVHFEDIMDRVREMGVVDFTLFREIAERFHVSLHNVYNYFYGYPMKVGVAA